MKKKGFFFVGVLLFPLLLAAETSHIDVCFTPGEDCTQRVVEAVNAAEVAVYVQAYSFTAMEIERALLAARARGVDVRVILDRSVLSTPHNVAELLSTHEIPVWIDEQLGIAHNKVMILDEARVVTGSFNFTRAAQTRNAENLLIIDDPMLAKKYLSNWESRERVSRAYYPVGMQQIVVPDVHERMDFLTWVKALWRWVRGVFKG